MAVDVRTQIDIARPRDEVSAFAADPDNAPRWYKGNTHTHTVNSDGDSTPDEVVRWYREQAIPSSAADRKGTDAVAPATIRSSPQ